MSLGNYHFCGGTVISEDRVLTAAHCCQGLQANILRVVAGEHNLFDEEGTEQVREPKKKSIRGGYFES